MTEKIRNDQDLTIARKKLKILYREIISLVLKKEEFEERIEEYLDNN